MPHIFFVCKCSGKGGPGGTQRKAKNPLSSSGALLIRSWYHLNTSSASSNSHSIGPPYTVLSECSLNTKEVTTPKLPPPPRSAQKRSLLVVLLAFTKLPSANTTFASSRLSMARP